jgi:hypothetical protein
MNTITIVNADGTEETRPFTAEEEALFQAEQLAGAWLELRNTRNQFLAGTDWTQAPDAPVDHEAWAAYRQQLRELPDTTTDPFNPVWPTPPNESTSDA